MSYYRFRTTLYHPQRDGLAERSNHTLLIMLPIVVDEHLETLKSYLRPICMAYTTNVQPTTDYFAFYLTFDRRAKLSIDIVYQ